MDGVVSETFVVCLRKLDRVPAEPLPWPYAVARKSLANERRRQARVAPSDVWLDAEPQPVHTPPGEGPGPHRHPYAETFIVQEGRATFTVGNDTIEAKAGDSVVAPAEVPHAFFNSGPGVLRSVNIHPVAEMETVWL